MASSQDLYLHRQQKHKGADIHGPTRTRIRDLRARAVRDSIRLLPSVHSDWLLSFAVVTTFSIKTLKWYMFN
jgi:hypothetical protein